jgi:hypothetical protein
MVIQCALLGAGAHTYMCPKTLVEPTPKLHALVLWLLLGSFGSCEVPRRNPGLKNETSATPPTAQRQRQQAGITAIGKLSPYPHPYPTPPEHLMNAQW